MNCNGKITQTCGTKMYAPCIQYELPLPEFSAIEGNCVSIEETTDDQYKLIRKLREEIDLSALGQECLTYVPNNQVAKVKDILLTYEKEICELKDKVKTLEETAICDKDITQCGIDLSGISDICNNPINTLGDLLTVLVAQITP